MGRMRVARGVVAVLMLVLALGVVVPSVAADDSSNGAVVVKGTGCGFGADILQVTTPSGNNVVVCQGEVAPPAQTTRYEGIPCYSFGEVTTNTSVVITKSGHETVVCRFNPSGQ